MDNDENKRLPAALPHQLADSVNALEQEGEGVSLGEIIAIVLQYRWLVAGITLLALLVGVAAVFVVRPEYRASGLIQVEEKGGSSASALKDLGPLLGLSGDTTVAAEQEILSSRMVLGKVIDKQHLDIVAEPRYFPIVGRAVARRHTASELADPVLGLSSYAWGGEAIQVGMFEVPRDMLDKRVELVVGNKGRFEVLDADGGRLLEGAVGTRVTEGRYAIFVAKLMARAGTRFVVTRRSPEAAMASLTAGYSIKERGKKSGILDISLQGEDPDKVAAVLDDILNTYVRQNVERRSAEAENTLRFLDAQLPVVKRQLDTAESAYNSYRQSRGSLDLTVETQSVLQSIVEVDNQIIALRQERDELRQYFTSEHPRIQATDARLEKLKARRAQFDGQINRLPDTQQTVLRLARDVEVNTTLYTNLLNTAQQLRVNKAGTIGSVRIIDPASLSSQKVGMKVPVVLALAGVVGVVLSLLTIYLLRLLNVAIEDPDKIEQQLGLPVYATIPHSSDEEELARRNKRKGGAGELLAITNPDDDAVESLRSLRTTLHFALLDSNRRSVLITGPRPGIGKSFVSKNLGVVLAQTGKCVVIVDADMRKGHIHREFGLPREGGLSEYISGVMELQNVLRATTVPNLSVITTGQIPPNPSELLMHPRLEVLMDELGATFDVVIIDAPPVLAVSDAAILGRLTGATLLVARAGVHPVRELEQAVKRLNQAGVVVKGFVFNDLDTRRQRYRYGYNGYVYRYSYKKS